MDALYASPICVNRNLTVTRGVVAIDAEIGKRNSSDFAGVEIFQLAIRGGVMISSNTDDDGDYGDFCWSSRNF
ncbi:hypothetical protein L1887_01352 [Cichorium endivia]|nr:hypothetical protein L1887_01352 [Cichorium endivia]